ncbi:MAG TPA: putative PEP-binding protein, partial [Stellaceae bacterium]|nr:putative PEP-binding protein [Stellaceae bacterium]
VLVRPGEDIQQAVEARLAVRRGQRQRYAALRDLPALTRDGVRVGMQLNSGLLIDLPYLEETGADGIGLYRTELQFMLRDNFPSVAEQAALYGRVLDHAGTRSVTFRTLDIGGDKPLPYMPPIDDENPAMGWRAIRITLDRPAILRQQLRAMVEAAAGRRLRVMFPMVADIAEFDAARALLERERERAALRGLMPEAIEVGVMIEVPALLFALDELLPKLDFLSVGTNDLVQFLYAADRGNPRLTERYDPLSWPVLRALQTLVKACAQWNVDLTLCGEMAGQTLDAMALIGVGVRNLSMAPASVGPVKSMLRSLELGSLRRFLQALEADARTGLRGLLRDFARDHGVFL